MNIYAILKGVGNGSLSVATDGAKAIGKLASAVSQSYTKGYEEAQAAAPIKWSPEDHRASIRRKMYDVSSKEWTDKLPSLNSLEEMKKDSVKTYEEE